MPTTVTTNGYRPRLALVSSARALHVVWHHGTSGTVRYRRLTPGGPSNVHHQFETGAAAKLYARVAAASDNLTSADPARDRVYIVWADYDGRGRATIAVAMSSNGGESFAIKPLTKRFSIVRNLIAKAMGKHVYIAWEGERTPGSPGPRAVWLAHTHNSGSDWKVERLTADDVPAIGSGSPTHDPFEIDLATSAEGKIVAVGFPYAEAVNQLGLPTSYGVKVLASRNHGSSFSSTSLQPPAPALEGLQGGPQAYRVRLALDADAVLHVAWQSAVSWILYGSHAVRQTIGGMLMYRQVYLPDLRVRPPVTKMPFVHPLEAAIPDPQPIQWPGQPAELIYLQGAFEHYSLAASTRWCCLVYNKIPSNPAPMLQVWDPEVAELVASGGHRAAVFDNGSAGTWFSLPARMADAEWGRVELSTNALVAMPSASNTRRFATVGLEHRFNANERQLLVTVFDAGRNRNEEGFPPTAPAVRSQALLTALKGAEWAVGQIQEDPTNEKSLVVMWEHGLSGSPLATILVSRSSDEGRTFD